MTTFNRKEYLLGCIQDEMMCLERANVLGYYNTRERIASWVSPVIKNAVPPGPVDVLEVGGGKGNAIVGIHEYFQRGNDPDHELSLSMTSFTKLPEHTKLKEQGVRVYTGVLAEAMPAVWAGRFDIVYTDSVLGWTKIRYAIPELFRVLKSGGIWYGFEDSIDIIPRMQSVPELVLRELDELGIRNELTLENIRSMRTIVPRVYPFMCRKP